VPQPGKIFQTFLDPGKGETLYDTRRNLEAMAAEHVVGPGMGDVGSRALYCRPCVARDVAIINAGDGNHAHPTQAMPKHC